MTLAPAPGVHSFLLENDGIIFDAVRQEVLGLNPTGAVIWCLMQDGQGPEQIAASLHAMTALSAENAATFTRDAIGDWSARGLLAGTVRPPAPASQQQHGSRTPLPAYPHPPPVFVRRRHYAFRRLRLTFQFTDRQFECLVHPALAHLEAEPDAAPILIDVIASPDRITLYRDGIPQSGCGTAEELAPLAKHLVWQTGLDAGDFLLNLHAGVIGGRNGVVLLPAPPGSGKSSLTAALMHAGYDYFSDEVALLGEDLTVSPFPLGLCVKDTGLDVIAAMYPGIRALPLHSRGDGKRVAYLSPEAARVPPADTRRPVSAILFPRFTPGAPGVPQPLGKSQALARLLEECFGVGPVLQAGHVRSLVRWIRAVPCYDLAFGTLADGVSAVAALAGEVPQASASEAPRRPR